jgi:excisionase family DNA binding protein
MTHSRETPALLTVEQTAERLGTSVRFVRRLRAERRLPFVKLGKHLRIDSADLEAFIDAHRERRWHQAS